AVQHLWHAFSPRCNVYHRLAGELGSVDSSNQMEGSMTLKPPLVFLMLIVMFIAVAPVAALQDSAKKDEEAKAREERRKKALTLAERGLANGVSQEVVNIMSTLSLTNRDAAQKLLDETLARLRTENYATNPTAAYVALNLLQRWIQRRTPSDAQTEPQGAG